MTDKVKALGKNGYDGKTKTQYSEYPAEFRQQILALVVSSGWLPRYRTLIVPEYFPTDVEVAFVAAVLDDYDEHGATPILGDVLLDLEKHKQFVEDVFALAANPPALKKTHSKVVEWARNQAYRLAMMEAIDLFQEEKEDLSNIRLLFQQAESVGQDVLDLGTELIKDAPEWLKEHIEEERFELPWPEVTANLDGGLSKGEMGIMMAPSNGGKSLALMNIGAHLANTVNKQNVLHITLEHRLKKVLARYAWRVTFKPIGEKSAEEYEALLMQHAKTKLNGRIRVKEYPKNRATVDTLREYMMRLQESGFYPDVVIVDYPDLLRAQGNHKEHRFDLREIIRDLSAFAVEFDVLVWAASQANRDSYKSKVIRMENVAEDIGKVQMADVVISINATKDEQVMDKGRFFVAKARDAKGKAVVAFKTTFPAMISTGLVIRDSDGEIKQGTTGKKSELDMQALLEQAKERKAESENKKTD